MARRAAVKDPRKKEYHEHHPMRVEGIMPHDMEGDGFIEFQILQGMTEEGYWKSVANGEEQADDYVSNGIPIPTDKLTADQKGWAKADHYDHFQKETARWRVVPGKESKVVPAKLAFQVRDLVYRDHCDDDEPKYVMWGYRWDLRPLHQCTICGEVIVKPPRSYNRITTDDKENHEQDDTDSGTGPAVEESDQAA
jgi:hypothetical protein